MLRNSPRKQSREGGKGGHRTDRKLEEQSKIPNIWEIGVLERKNPKN